MGAGGAAGKIRFRCVSAACVSAPGYIGGIFGVVTGISGLGGGADFSVAEELGTGCELAGAFRLLGLTCAIADDVIRARMPVYIMCFMIIDFCHPDQHKIQSKSMAVIVEFLPHLTAIQL